MRAVPSLTLIFLIASTFTGCTLHPSRQKAAAALSAVTVTDARITLHTLYPKLAATPWTNTPQTFHGFTILGTAEIRSPAEKRALLDALIGGIQHSPRVTPSCFYPRHGLTIHSDTNTSDYVICFECHKVRVYHPRSHLAISTTPRATFNTIAAAHHLPLAGASH